MHSLRFFTVFPRRYRLQLLQFARRSHSQPSTSTKEWTRSEVIKSLKEHNVFYEISENTKFIRADCPECPGELSSFISSLDGSISCIECGYEAHFDSDYPKRISVRKVETTTEDQIKRKEEKQIEETLRQMESPEEFDSDLHDQVSYLNLINKYKDSRTARKHDRMMRTRDDSDAPSPRVNENEGITTSMPPDPNIKQLWNGSVEIGDLDELEQNEMLQLKKKLGLERISKDTLARYNVRAHMDNYDQVALVLPRYKGIAGRLRVPPGLKVIRKVGENVEKENYPLPDETVSKQKFSGIFGYHMMTNSDRAVILTTNERDALAVYEGTDGALALSLPLAERLDPSVFLYLEDFEQIFLWFPKEHQKQAKEWGFALNGNRCYLIKSADRPIELLRNNKKKDIKAALSNSAVRMRDKGFRSMSDVRESIKNDIIYSERLKKGFAEWKRYSALNKYLGGLRPGEITVITGTTGIGKTTFLCEYALDLFTQGVRTLFCSFEMPEERILKWMLIQYAGKPLSRVEYTDEIETWLDKFENVKGPLTMMHTSEFAGKSITEIAKAIQHHVEINGCQHVVIDNLQFLVNQTTLHDDSSSSHERWHHQDRFLGYMRLMATNLQIHITIVAHPKKSGPDEDLTVAHLSGTSRVTQEADNVLAIQQKRNERDPGKSRKYFYILKTRYGSRKVESDTLELVFNRSSYSYQLLDHSRT